MIAGRLINMLWLRRQLVVEPPVAVNALATSDRRYLTTYFVTLFMFAGVGYQPCNSSGNTRSRTSAGTVRVVGPETQTGRSARPKVRCHTPPDAP